MKPSLVLALLMTAQVCSGAVPRYFQEEAFNPSSFAEAVNHFVALGEESALQELQALALDFSNQSAWSTNIRIGWICRVLFDPKGTEPLRQPRYGALDFPHKSMPPKSWPLYPVALSGSTYFVLGARYSIGGRPEEAKDYIEYCRTNGVFRKSKVTVPTKDQALRDAAALRKSKAWTDIKWTDSGENWSYAMDERETWEFIRKQAESIR